MGKRLAESGYCVLVKILSIEAPNRQLLVYGPVLETLKPEL
jgi:hypothetical protein